MTANPPCQKRQKTLAIKGASIDDIRLHKFVAPMLAKASVLHNCNGMNFFTALPLTRAGCLIGLIALFGFVLNATAPLAKSREEQVHDFASMFGVISAGDQGCRNLSLAALAALKKAIRVYSNSSTPSVKQGFHEARNMAKRTIRDNPKKHCAFIAKNFPQFFKETR